MISDRRPYQAKRLHRALERFYARHFIAPQFAQLGDGAMFMKPWHVRVYGADIRIGRHLHLLAARDRLVSFSTWKFEERGGRIDIGDHCLICPGVRIDSASHIDIADDCMLAAGVYVTDADWHDLYDRTRPVGNTRPVHLARNVWLGDGSTVCKGVSIGEDSIIGAGAVVTRDIPAGVIAAGNPARVVRELDPQRDMVRRRALFEDAPAFADRMDQLDRYMLQGNTWRGWLRSICFPRPGD